ncbi:3-dehydroquinate synthase [Arcanobacterium buesumense]|uniref:Multifunctional fusion protein n=1 Tax=Arcanobacterium buesumense TaxID=2722751 RepID=A0A6H2EKM5_9ACTO|nr:3-dehydroquinate synthase [Arcanobacterium buesumense]QJC21754.1 3-dehydroquinate synthase [Arcanobacterium buesumense]
MTLSAVIVGMPGAGKTTVGRIVAHRLRLPFADSDRLITQKTGMAVADIFAQFGQHHFRDVEHDVIREACEHRDGILSVGGGALLDPRTRKLLAQERVIFIDVDDDVLIARLRRSRTVRPVLGDDIAGSVARLRSERSAFYYEVASEIVMSDDRGLNVVVGQVLDRLSRPQTIVKVDGDDPYQVVVGSDLVPQIVRALRPASKVFLIHSPNLTSFVGRIDEHLSHAGLRSLAFELPDGEAAKSRTVVDQLWDIAGQAHLGRDCVVLAVGGGATTDVAGFFASTWMRGVRLVCVPTTLLAMVDAAVGGKTAINTGQGKNLVGTFWPPSQVFCDTDVLSSLSEVERISGLAEVAKCGFIADHQIITMLESANYSLQDLIARSIRVKAEVVSQDLRETGLREVLNYGHTLGHAIERVENYSWKHGYAVAVGCVFAAALAVHAGFAPIELIDQQRQILKKIGLPTTYAIGKRDQVEEAMRVDKKVRDGQLRFVVVDQDRAMHIVQDPDIQALDFAWEQIQ